MKKIFIEGGYQFMAVLTLTFFIILSLSVINGFAVMKFRKGKINQLKKRISYIKSLAVFTLVFGIFSQLWGMIAIFDYISKSMKRISAELLVSGLKISMFPAIYGIFIFLVSYLIYRILVWRLNARI